MTGLPGFEPGIHGIKTRCLTAWLQPNDNGEGRIRTFELERGRIYSPLRLATSLPHHEYYNDPYGDRTRDTTVKGWCLNRLTKGP